MGGRSGRFSVRTTARSTPSARLCCGSSTPCRPRPRCTGTSSCTRRTRRAPRVSRQSRSSARSSPRLRYASALSIGATKPSVGAVRELALGRTPSRKMHRPRSSSPTGIVPRSRILGHLLAQTTGILTFKPRRWHRHAANQLHHRRLQREPHWVPPMLHHRQLQREPHWSTCSRRELVVQKVAYKGNLFRSARKCFNNGSGLPTKMNLATLCAVVQWLYSFSCRIFFF